MTPRPKRMHRPPILFIHGAWHAGWCWDNWAEFFRGSGYETTAIDLRGHGMAAGSYRHARLADYLLDVEQALQNFSEPPILIGHSMGGFIMQYLMARQTYPAAVFVATIPPGGLPRRETLQNTLQHPAIALRSLAARDMRPWIEHPSTIRSMFFSSGLADSALQTYANKLQGESFELFTRDLMRTAPPVLPGTPSLLLSGEQEPTIKPAYATAAARALGGELRIIAESGHDIMLDVGWQTAAEQAREWLETALGSDA